MNPPNPSPVGTRGTRHEPVVKPATNWDGVRHKGPQIASLSLCARKVQEKHQESAHKELILQKEVLP